MKRIVLVRHGESQWNMENRFTGWTNVDLTEKGKEEAFAAGRLLKENGFHFDIAYTSYLKRAVKTLNNVLDAMDEDWIPVEKSWRLNEKHYGMLQGLNKAETAAKYGDEQVLLWRRSFDVAPHELPADGIGSALTDPRYALVPEDYLPTTESLKDAIERVMPYWECTIFPKLKEVDCIIVGAHGNHEAQHPDGYPVRIRVRRQAPAREGLLPRRRRRDRSQAAGSGQPGQGQIISAPLFS